MSNPKHGTKPTRPFWVAGTALTALTAIATAVFSLLTTTAEASPTAPAPVIAVSVAIVVNSDAATWHELPVRLEAVERAEAQVAAAQARKEHTKSEYERA